MWGLALGHILFSLPPVITATINHWNSWAIFNHRSEKGADVDDVFGKLVYTILNDGVDFQMKLRRCQDIISASSRMSYELSTVYNADTRHLSHFAISETVLLAALTEMGDEPNEFRMRCVVGYLFSDVYAKLFSHVDESVGSNGSHFRNFLDNDVLEWCQDRSAFFIALGIYLMNYLDQALADEKRVTEEDDPLHAARVNARCEAGRDLFDRYEQVIHAINEKHTGLQKLRLVLPDALCLYKPDTLEDDAILLGVPIAVLESEHYTLLWMKWVWEEYLGRDECTIRSIMQNLWLAKSAFLMTRFIDFFEGTETTSGFDDYLLAFAEIWVQQAK